MYQKVYEIRIFPHHLFSLETAKELVLCLTDIFSSSCQFVLEVEHGWHPVWCIRQYEAITPTQVQALQTLVEEGKVVQWTGRDFWSILPEEDQQTESPPVLQEERGV
jgi:hypothetical protein